MPVHVLAGEYRAVHGAEYRPGLRYRTHCDQINLTSRAYQMVTTTNHIMQKISLDTLVHDPGYPGGFFCADPPTHGLYPNFLRNVYTHTFGSLMNLLHMRVTRDDIECGA